MGCNCNKTRPMGSGLTPKQVAENQAAKASTGNPQPKPTSGTTQSFQMSDGAGGVQTFGSKLELEAAKVRARSR